MKYCARGFTLIEFMAVMAITSVIALSVYPIFQGGYGLEGAAQVIASDLTQTQISAMTNNQSRTFTTGQSSYQYDQGATNEGYERNLAELGEHLVITPNVTISFNSIGEPSSPDPVTFTITLGGSRKTITIVPYTGATIIR